MLPMKTQEDDSSIMAMWKTMNHLLKLFANVEHEERKRTNLWRCAHFQVLVATYEANRYIEDNIATDSISCNKAA